MTRTCALIATLLLTASAAHPAPEVANEAAPSKPASVIPLAPLGAPGHWSIVTAETVSPDRDAIAFEAGWPGLSVSYLHGTSDRSDVGIRFDLLYGYENTSDTAFGLGADVPFRLVVNRSNRVSVALHVDPGLRIYSRNSQTDFMTRFPLGAAIGVQATPEVRVAASADLTMAFNWTHTTFFEIGPQFGVAAEYASDRNLTLGLNTKFGPQFVTLSNTGAQFAFTVQVVVGYRM
jgi:hypothetical protein